MEFRLEAREMHSVPIDERAWRNHAVALGGKLEALADLIPAPDDEYFIIQVWVQKILDHRQLAASLLYALQPFTAFDSGQAKRTLRLLNAATTTAADGLEGDSQPAETIRQGLRDAAQWWVDSGTWLDDRHLLQIAFAMPEAPMDDEGRFRADLVLQHYAYRNGDLLAALLPQLVSLGVPHVTDVLVGVSIVGSILDCDDSVSAYVAMDMFFNRYLEASPEVAASASTHLRASEPALRRSVQAASRSYHAASLRSKDAEVRAFALADAYKRTVEGPFRQFSWVLYCLGKGVWAPPVMLGSLRERLAAEGGRLGAIARDVVIPALRNSETHETLAWDGFAEEYVTEDGRVHSRQVAIALTLGDSFVRGCEAGYLATQTLEVRLGTNMLPSHEEVGRMPSWRRVQAFFGTNRLRLTEARVNTPHAFFRLERLEHSDINPCFQALLLARRLLPVTETFTVADAHGAEPILVVTAGALDMTMPVWELAVSTVDRMPLATFLPANLDARTKAEPIDLAVRSVAWIVVDDVVGTIDGSPDSWDETELRLLDARLTIAELAIKQTQLRAPQPSPRLISVLASTESLRRWIAKESPRGPKRVEDHPSLVRLRMQWERWGPVPRHPLVREMHPNGASEREPKLRAKPRSMHYRTL